MFCAGIYCDYNNQIDIYVFSDYLDEIKNEVLAAQHDLCF